MQPNSIRIPAKTRTDVFRGNSVGRYRPECGPYVQFCAVSSRCLLSLGRKNQKREGRKQKLEISSHVLAAPNPAEYPRAKHPPWLGHVVLCRDSLGSSPTSCAAAQTPPPPGSSLHQGPSSPWATELPSRLLQVYFKATFAVRLPRLPCLHHMPIPSATLYLPTRIFLSEICVISTL